MIDFADIKKNSQLKPSNTRTRYLTDDEETRLLAELSDEDRDFYVTLLDSGARWGEVAKLPWSQVDIDNRVILLYRFKTKNESLLPMTDRVYETMKRRHAAKRIDQKFVFENSEQNSRNYSLSPIKRAAKRAGVAGVTHHVARHTVGTRLTIAGESPQTLQALFGHSTINMSMRYQHMSPSTAMTKAISALNKQ